MLLPWPSTAGVTNLDIRALPVSQSGMFAVLLHKYCCYWGNKSDELHLQVIFYAGRLRLRFWLRV